MKERFRTVLFVVALGMVGMNIHDNGLQIGNALIGLMLLAVFAVSFYFHRKRRLEEAAQVRSKEAERRSRRRARKSAQKQKAAKKKHDAERSTPGTDTRPDEPPQDKE